MAQQLKLLPPAKPRLGLYLRPGRNDHTVFLQLLAEGRAVSGLVLDARHAARHGGLREALVDNGVHAVLDPNFMEMTTIGGRVLSGLDRLPWFALADASASDLRGQSGRELAASVADFVQAGEYSAVIAPTHLLSGSADEQFGADRAVASTLRAELDKRGLRNTAIFYPLAIPAGTLRNQAQRAVMVAALKSVDVDAIWLRIHPFGTSSAGPLALRRYVEGAWRLQEIGVPLVAEKSGTVGVALMAFGAVGGIESGITMGERFDVSNLVRPRRPGAEPFSPAPRVYLHSIGTFVSRKVARTIFENRQMIAALGCKDANCCPRGARDMVLNPRRHFVLRRVADVDQIGSVPPEHRATSYIHDVLRPALLLAVRAARVSPDLAATQHRLEGWNQTLTAIGDEGALPAPAPALGQRIAHLRHIPRAVK